MSKNKDNGYSPNKTKAINKLGKDTVEEMEALGADGLKKVIVDAATAMRTAKEELEALPAYQDAKYNLSVLSQGKRDVDARQKLKTQFALEILEGCGKLSKADLMHWEYEQEQRRLTLDKEKKAKADAQAAEDKLRAERAALEASGVLRVAK